MKLVYLYLTINMMHGPVNIRCTCILIVTILSVKCYCNSLRLYYSFYHLVRSSSKTQFVFIFPSYYRSTRITSVSLQCALHLGRYQHFTTSDARLNEVGQDVKFYTTFKLGRTSHRTFLVNMKRVISSGNSAINLTPCCCWTTNSLIHKIIS